MYSPCHCPERPVQFYQAKNGILTGLLIYFFFQSDPLIRAIILSTMLRLYWQAVIQTRIPFFIIKPILTIYDDRFEAPLETPHCLYSFLLAP